MEQEGVGRDRPVGALGAQAGLRSGWWPGCVWVDPVLAGSCILLRLGLCSNPESSLHAGDVCGVRPSRR